MKKNKSGNFIQWKGTDVCMDFNCKCGYAGHVDGYFAYYIQCPECETVYKMSETVEMEETKDDIIDPLIA